jgi:DNA-binding beta-propeller fold protein YncE
MTQFANDSIHTVRFMLLLCSVKLVHSFPRDKPVIAITALDRELFVQYFEQLIEVFDMDTFASLRRLSVEGLKSVASMTSCKKHQFIYIADNGNCIVHRIDRIRNQQTKWEVDFVPEGLSVTSEYNVIVTSRWFSIMTVYTTHGDFVKKITLQHPDILYLCHAIQLSTEEYVVCHRGYSNMVIRVDDCGHIKKSYCRSSEAVNEQPFRPCRLALVKNGFIVVADTVNQRLVMLSTTLRYVKSWNVGGGPTGLLYDKKTDRLFVAVNEMNDECMYFNGWVEIFSLS